MLAYAHVAHTPLSPAHVSHLHTHFPRLVSLAVAGKLQLGRDALLVLLLGPEAAAAHATANGHAKGEDAADAASDTSSDDLSTASDDDEDSSDGGDDLEDDDGQASPVEDLTMKEFEREYVNEEYPEEFRPVDRTTQIERAAARCRRRGRNAEDLEGASSSSGGSDDGSEPEQQQEQEQESSAAVEEGQAEESAAPATAAVVGVSAVQPLGDIGVLPSGWGLSGQLRGLSLDVSLQVQEDALAMALGACHKLQVNPRVGGLGT